MVKFDSGVPLLNLRRVPCPTFKLRGGSRVPDPRVPRFWVPGSWFQYYTMPCGIIKNKFK